MANEKVAIWNQTIKLGRPPANGELLIGDGTGFNLANITAGSNVTISNTAGGISIASSNPGGTLTAVTASSPLASSGGTTPNISLSGTVGVANGGTGQTSYTDGQLLIGNTTGNTLAKATLTAGTNVAITNGSGSITIAVTGVDLTSRMTSNVDFTSNTTFADLTGLSFTADANSIYVMEAFIYATFAGAGKFKLRVTGPSSTEIFFGGTENNGIGLNVTSAGTTTAFSSDLFNFTAAGAVTTGIAHLYGTFNVGNSGGTVQIQGAQAASSATTTSFKTGSWVQYRKVT